MIYMLFCLGGAGGGAGGEISQVAWETYGQTFRTTF